MGGSYLNYGNANWKNKFGNSNGMPGVQGGGTGGGGLGLDKPVTTRDVTAPKDPTAPPKPERVDLNGTIAGYRDLGNQMVKRAEDNGEDVTRARESARKKSLADFYYRQLTGANKPSANTRNPMGDVPENERRGVLEGYVPMGEATREAGYASETELGRHMRQKRMVEEGKIKMRDTDPDVRRAREMFARRRAMNGYR